MKGFTLDSLANLIKGDETLTVENSQRLNVVHHILLDESSAKVFGETYVTMYSRRVRQANLLLKADSSSLEWQSLPAISLEYADIGGD